MVCSISALEALEREGIAVTRKSGLDSMPENKKLWCLMVLLNSAKASYAAYLKTYRSILASDTAYENPSTSIIAMTFRTISTTCGNCTVRYTKGTRLTLRKHSMFHFSPNQRYWMSASAWKEIWLSELLQIGVTVTAIRFFEVWVG